MTSLFPEQDSDSQIFVLSAMGSLLFHGLLMAGLASMPPATTVKEEPPTVQVNLLPAPQPTPTPETATPPLQPRTAMRAIPPPPLPLNRPLRPQPPTPPLQAALTPSPPMKLAPLTPPSAKPVLQDTRASKALNVRAMMKMRVPTHTQQTTHSLPTRKTRIYSQSRVAPRLPTIEKERVAAQSLPAPPTLRLPRALTASPPTQAGSTLSRPTIISSSRPAYPRVARESGWEGTVIVRTLISTNGRPNKVTLRKSCGHPTLDQAAQDAVQRWTFQPAKDGNIPISKWVDIPIKFDLNS